MKTLLIILLTLAACVATSPARVITFFLTGVNQTNCITLRDYEVLKILSTGTYNLNMPTRASFIKESRRVDIPVYPIAASPIAPIVLTGSLELRFESWKIPDDTGFGTAWLTVEILPEAYALDKSVTVGPGPGGAVVALETSTNLLDWTAVSTGTYTNLPDARFFRIKTERVPCQ